MQSIDLIEIYAYGTSRDQVCKKGETKLNSIIKQHKNVWLWLYYKIRHQRT